MRNGSVSCGAHTDHFDKMVAEARRLGAEENVPTMIVPQRDQHQELGTDAYFGGVVFTHHCICTSGKILCWHFANGAGCRGAGDWPLSGKLPLIVLGLASSSTSQGKIWLGKVVVATNPYSGSLMPYLQRRLIPIGSYIIATEPLSKS